LACSNAAQRDRGKDRAYRIGKRLHFGFCEAGELPVDEISGVHEALQKVSVAAGDPFGRLGKTFPGMEFAYHRGAEFIRHGSGKKKADAFLDFRQIKRRKSDCFGVFGLGIFDIHGDVIDKLPFDERFQLIREAAVGIELDRIAERFDFGDEAVDIVVEKRLPSGDTYAVEDADTFFQKREKFVGFYGSCRSGIQYKRGVMTKGTSEIAASRKNGTGDFAGVIEQGELLQSFYFHIETPFPCMVLIASRDAVGGAF